jgi:threonine synthase
MILQPKKVIHRCVRCSRTFVHELRPFCDCGAMIDVEYDVAHVRLHDSRNSLVRYFDLLPIEDPASLLDVELPLTPCVHATRLGRQLGMPRLFLKDETHNPTRTTKDRMAAVALSYLRDCGTTAFCVSSTGNSSSSFAALAPLYRGCRVYLFTAEDFVDRVTDRYGAEVVHFGLRGATFVEAFDCAGQYAARAGIASERGFFNPGRREGLKLAWLEASEQVPGPIDWYVQAVSSGMGVYGCYKGGKELVAMGRAERAPKLLCVQQETCSPMARAFLEGSAECTEAHVVRRPTGIAKAILRGDPRRVYPYVRSIVEESGGTFAIVSEDAIREARQMLAELEGVDACFSASAALAGLAKLVREGLLASSETVLVNLTGGDRSQEIAARPQRAEPLWLRRAGSGWEPEDPNDLALKELWSRGCRGSPPMARR